LAALNRSITIAGGGLAGLSLASALRLHNVEVTVLEAGGYPRHRVCGEFISGVSEATLENLGIRDLFSSAHRHRSLKWHHRGRLIHQAKFPEAAYGISRYQLDEKIRLRLLELGGKIQTGIRARAEPRDGLVWAAGRKPCRGQWIGLKAHVRGLPRTADLEMHMGSNGYAGLAEVEDGWTNLCGLFLIDRQIPAKGADLLAAYLVAGGNHALARDMAAAEWRVGSFSAMAGFALGRQPSPPNLLCIGDAESMIPPFTGNGMSMAFQAAEATISPLVAWTRKETSWAEATHAVQHRLKKKFQRRLRVAQALHPFLFSTTGRGFLDAMATLRLLPLSPLLHLIR